MLGFTNRDETPKTDVIIPQFVSQTSPRLKQGLNKALGFFGDTEPGWPCASGAHCQMSHNQNLVWKDYFNKNLKIQTNDFFFRFVSGYP